MTARSSPRLLRPADKVGLAVHVDVEGAVKQGAEPCGQRGERVARRQGGAVVTRQEVGMA